MADLWVFGDCYFWALASSALSPNSTFGPLRARPAGASRVEAAGGHARGDLAAVACKGDEICVTGHAHDSRRSSWERERCGMLGVER
eukprot:1007076-Pleurochrysis_carterae.AAC.2